MNAPDALRDEQIQFGRDTAERMYPALHAWAEARGDASFNLGWFAYEDAAKACCIAINKMARGRATRGTKRGVPGYFVLAYVEKPHGL